MSDGKPGSRVRSNAFRVVFAPAPSVHSGSALTFCVFFGLITGASGCAGLAASGAGAVGPPPGLDSFAVMPAATQAEPELTAAAILGRAHAAAGGEEWVRPRAVLFEGYNLIHGKDGLTVWDDYRMWRVFADAKPEAHAANGKVRIEAWSGDRLAMLISFDGVDSHAYQDGAPKRLEGGASNPEWSNNFGFGAIRNALDPGWTQKRLPDDLVDGEPSYMVELLDPSGGMTRFGIRRADFAIVYVGFRTARGWHERRYSHFFTVPGTKWVQPGRVRLSYDGVKANEAIWTRVSFADDFDPALFRLETPLDRAAQ